jgi:hypothetical protein
MTTAIGIMDREGWEHRTDILVVVDPIKKEVLWVPRDLYCEIHANRINKAFMIGGHALLKAAFLEHEIRIDHSICVLRSTVEKALENYQITVPVSEYQEFHYPLQPQEPIENGYKLVQFSPPQDFLEGDRFHQWMGARVPPEGYNDASSDLLRLQRQQVLLKRLLEEKFDFSSVDKDGLDISSAEAYIDLQQIRPDWNFYTLAGITPATIRKMYVFVRESQLESRA